MADKKLPEFAQHRIKVWDEVKARRAANPLPGPPSPHCAPFSILFIFILFVSFLAFFALPKVATCSSPSSSPLPTQPSPSNEDFSSLKSF